MKTLNADYAILSDLYEARFAGSGKLALSTIFERRQIDVREGRLVAKRLQEDGLIKTSSLAHHKITARGALVVEEARVLPETLVSRCKRARRQTLGLAVTEQERGVDARLDYGVLLTNVAEEEDFLGTIIELLLELDFLRCPASRAFVITRAGMRHLEALGGLDPR